jgi:hypothetical protein
MKHRTRPPARLAGLDGVSPLVRRFDETGKTLGALPLHFGAIGPFRFFWSFPSFIAALINPPGHRARSNLIKPNQTQSKPINLSRRRLGEGGCEKTPPRGFDRVGWRPNRQILPVLVKPLEPIRPQGLTEWASPPPPSNPIKPNQS